MNEKRPIAEFERAVILAVLRLGDKAYGVAIRHELQNSLERSVSFGAVYTTLDRLLGKGLLSSFIADPTPERGGRAKKYFLVTKAGSAALDHALRASRAIWAMSPSRALK
jgi:PadR family transcriptional regulator, regulatory protein PadR